MKNKWYGYLHANGSIQVKRFFDSRDLFDCHDSPFVADYTQPFDADDREDALRKAKDRLAVR